ncbi:MAG: class I and II aminotransferase [bacterium]|nr:MAG: class I and II aminotransferase [bacterium]KAF0148362.1 MAG: class I and II aminotransferase [bacterium]KAF0167823.1 MAG: class I and II aminotransferase [bacterium]TXT18971.1 MAG: class I and II aminotransferase [bacterium]
MSPPSFDFDRPIPRAGSDSLKWDGRRSYFGTEDVLPMWVADMDFAAPEAVIRALVARAEHPVYGYTLFPDGLYEALIAWMRDRHGWRIERDWILLAPGVVPSLHAAVLAFAAAGEGVIVQPPVYFPFFSSVTTPGRRLIENPLREEAGRYRMDFDHLEQCAARADARLLLLCSPHNPVGRVWDADELREVLRIARRHGLVVLSDEIHHDLVYRGEKHTPLALLADAAAEVVTAVAPSKTFNIPGLGLSALIVPDAGQRERLRRAFDLLHVSGANPFSIAAFAAAYREGGPWLDALLGYLAQTREAAITFFDEHMPAMRPLRPQGTYLLWLDCRGLGLGDAALRRFFVEEARVGMNPGPVFGTGGEGFMRLNLGAPRSVVMAALERMRSALAGRRQRLAPALSREK